MRLLVTGGSGYIGSRFMAAMAARPDVDAGVASRTGTVDAAGSAGGLTGSEPLDSLTAMKPMSLDTPPEVEELMLDAYRRMTPAEKLGRVVELSRAAEAMAAARIRATYGPDLPERELRLRLAALRLDRETMIEVFDWDPEEKGY